MLPLILMLVIMQPGRTFVGFAARTQFHIRLSGVYRPLAFCLWFATMVARAGEGAAAPVSPNERIHLFNGKDLSGFYTWLVDTKREDPRHVFVVTNGVIRISGEGLGYLATEKEYQDYHPRQWRDRLDPSFARRANRRREQFSTGRVFRRAGECDPARAFLR